MIRSLIWLTALWVALWGEVSVGNVAAGLAIAAVVEVAFPSGARVVHTVKVVPALSFTLFVLWSVVTSSVRVMAAVLRPTPARTEVHMVDVALASSSPSIISITTNTISLTPGTLTIDHDPVTNVITVHVLGRIDEDEFRREVLAHEQRVVRFLVPKSARGEKKVVQP